MWLSGAAAAIARLQAALIQEWRAIPQVRSRTQSMVKWVTAHVTLRGVGEEVTSNTDVKTVF